jgi:peptidoglycan hydrolase-like protein with peptidoglycan-binding domain
VSILKVGNRGQEVLQLQLLLNGHLGPKIKLKNDGDFGRDTENAVREFQKKKGLKQDGIVGKNTWLALGAKQSTTSKGANNTQKTIGAPWYDIAVAEIGVSELLGKEKNNIKNH